MNHPANNNIVKRFSKLVDTGDSPDDAMEKAITEELVERRIDSSAFTPFLRCLLKDALLEVSKGNQKRQPKKTRSA